MSTTEQENKPQENNEGEEEMPQLENQEDKSNLNRGEKKCRKALLKLGMKAVAGINRVTLRKRDGLIFVINNPEVLKNAANDNSYAVFGELKLDDGGIGKDIAKGFESKPNAADNEGAAAGQEEDKKGEEEDGPLNEEGLTANHIDMVMQHAGCSRNDAIKALRDANDDMVQAVMALTK